MALTLSLEGQTALITGGASGIGRATATLLAQAGAKIAIFDIDDEAGRTLIESIGESARYYHCDMADFDAISNAYHQVMTELGRVDVLVNNVGIWVPGGDILQMSDDVIERMDAVNVNGPRHLTRLVMNGMKDHGGCVVFVSSTQADVIDGAPTIYNVEKNTILGMTKTFAIAGGPLGIRVNAVSPGAIATEGMGAAHAVGKDRIIAGNHKTPLGRRGKPEEVAFEILSLCFATYTNGDNRIVDGGFSKVALPAELTPSPSKAANNPDAEYLAQL